jgi:molybdopterin-guanine dinucleotide biosynthesis protein A
VTERAPLVLAGIFVGGASRRMGGVPKGLLPAPDKSGETLVARTRRILEASGVGSVLVGAHEAYRDLGLEVVADAGEGAGPIGGLAALLDHAAKAGALAIAVGCDMPYVSEGLVRALLSAPAAVAVAPKRGRLWEPFFARYDAEAARPIVRARLEARDRSLQSLLDALGARELALGEADRRLLADWDTPEAVKR